MESSESQDKDFGFDSESNREPVKRLENGSEVGSPVGAGQKTCCRALDKLSSDEFLLVEASEQAMTEVQPWRDKSMNDRLQLIL